jgi:galactosylceramide sulfotransferase
MDDFHHFLWPLPFQKDFVQNKVPQPNILLNHARFNSRPLMELMPETTKYVTILRHPATQFTSLFKFMDLGGLIGAKGNHTSTISLDYFLDNAFRILKTLHQHNSKILINNPSLYLLRNPQLFDLGFDQSFSENESHIREIIARISNKFHLVLIMEYFDESLVLLKRKMCWSLEDVVYFKLNKQIGMNEPYWNPGIRGKIMQWTKADVLLYEYFNKSLWNEIKNEGVSFWEEVALLRKKNRELSKTCLRAGVFIDRPYKGSTAIIYGYSLKTNISIAFKLSCKRMVRSEIKYIQYFRTIYHRF